LKHSLIAAALAVLALALPPLSPAQSQNLSATAGATTVIAGVSLSCIDFRGKDVRTVKVDELGDVGRAWVVDTNPFIVMGTHLLQLLPPKLQLFFYAHECAHHVLAHWYNPSLGNEKEADCWAIRYGRDTNLFRRQEVVDFAPWLERSNGSRYGHLPGPLRSRYLLECFDSSEPLLISDERKGLFMR